MHYYFLKSGKMWHYLLMFDQSASLPPQLTFYPNWTEYVLKIVKILENFKKNSQFNHFNSFF